ncbi:DUF4920 domain-containing protein [Sphingobacteriaceae bacterium]|nr:DUF4920 domain-containing protein [Sphingobacteriaceae bacterium]
MKKVSLILVAVLYVQFFVAQPPAGKATPGTTYGAKTDAKNAVSASELPALLKSKDTVAVKVKATVLEVCSKKGCWMNFKVNDEQNAFVKMKDYAFFVPLDLIGKTVVLDGKAYTKITSVSELKHYAEDAKKPQKEIDAITQPKSEIRFMADGIVVVE